MADDKGGLMESNAGVRAAVEQAERFKDLEAGQTAILGHCERIEDHLGTLNGKTGRNIEDIGNLRALVLSHLTEVEARREVVRLEAVEAAVATLQAAQTSATDHASGRDEVLGAFDKLLIRAAPLGVLALAIYTAFS